MSHELNLAERPFLNPRPVKRVTILLWVLGAAVAVFNAYLYVSHYSGSSEIRERQQELAESLAREEQQVEKLEAELASYDLMHQNEQSVFLNAKISERSFSWSTLFDRLGEVMPADVRLSSLSPSFGDDSRSNRSGTRENEVLLGIRGSAKGSEVLLEFVDALFEHESFRVPDLNKESLQDGGLLDFNLSVIYEARRPPAVAETSEAVAETSEAVAETSEAVAADPETPAGEAAAEGQSDGVQTGRPATAAEPPPASSREGVSR